MSDSWKIFGITITVLIVIISVVLIFAYLSRECNTNLECNQNEYCAYNHKCIEFPANKETNLLPSALVIAVSIIISAFTIRKGLYQQQSQIRQTD